MSHVYMRYACVGSICAFLGHIAYRETDNKTKTARRTHSACFLKANLNLLYTFPVSCETHWSGIHDLIKTYPVYRSSFYWEWRHQYGMKDSVWLAHWISKVDDDLLVVHPKCTVTHGRPPSRCLSLIQKPKHRYQYRNTLTWTLKIPEIQQQHGVHHCQRQIPIAKSKSYNFFEPTWVKNSRLQAYRSSVHR